MKVQLNDVTESLAEWIGLYKQVRSFHLSILRLAPHTRRVGIMLRLYTCIEEVLGPNLLRNTGFVY